jgi:hypothetical protein
MYMKGMGAKLIGSRVWRESSKWDVGRCVYCTDRGRGRMGTVGVVGGVMERP